MKKLLLLTFLLLSLNGFCQDAEKKPILVFNNRPLIGLVDNYVKWLEEKYDYSIISIGKDDTGADRIVMSGKWEGYNSLIKLNCVPTSRYLYQIVVDIEDKFTDFESAKVLFDKVDSLLEKKFCKHQREIRPKTADAYKEITSQFKPSYVNIYDLANGAIILSIAPGINVYRIDNVYISIIFEDDEAYEVGAQYMKK